MDCSFELDLQLIESVFFMYIFHLFPKLLVLNGVYGFQIQREDCGCHLTERSQTNSRNSSLLFFAFCVSLSNRSELRLMGDLDIDFFAHVVLKPT